MGLQSLPRHRCICPDPTKPVMARYMVTALTRIPRQCEPVPTLLGQRLPIRRQLGDESDLLFRRDLPHLLRNRSRREVRGPRSARTSRNTGRPFAVIRKTGALLRSDSARPAQLPKSIACLPGKVSVTHSAASTFGFLVIAGLKCCTARTACAMTRR